MQAVIQALCEIDASASKMMETAEARKAELQKSYEHKAQIEESKITSETNLKIEQLKNELDEKVALELAKIRQEAAEDISRLEENYQQNKEHYVNSIFSKITGRAYD